MAFLLTRRRFISLNIAGVAGIQQLISCLLPMAAQEPTPTPSSTPTPTPVPPIPARPFLTAGEVDEIARGQDYLDIDWLSVSNANAYDIRFVGPNGDEDIRENVQHGSKFATLASNRIFRISVRARNASGASDWSPALTTCTRLPAPPAPSILPAQMIQTTADTSVYWDLRTFVAGLDGAKDIKVILGKRESTGSIVPVQANLFELAGTFISHTDSTVSTYHLKLTFASTCAPTGANQSDWGAGVTRDRPVFAEMRTPGTAELLYSSARFSRRYYGQFRI